MIVVDTNILVRYLTKDDPVQTQIATHFLKQNQCFILKTILLETVWVLISKAGYGWTRPLVLERLKHLLGLPGLYAEDAQGVANALEWYEKGMDFADALHMAGSLEQGKLATFDKTFVNRAEKVQTLVVVEGLETEADK